jgi:hypothetical protein
MWQNLYIYGLEIMTYIDHYLRRFGISNSLYCGCGYGNETVEHYLTIIYIRSIKVP